MQINVVNIIIDSLLANGKCSVDGLGTFILNKDQPVIDQKSKRIIGPKSTVSFEERIHKDFSLEDELLKVYPFSKEKSEKVVSLFANKVVNGLINFDRIELTNLGELKNNKTQSGLTFTLSATLADIIAASEPDVDLQPFISAKESNEEKAKQEAEAKALKDKQAKEELERKTLKEQKAKEEQAQRTLREQKAKEEREKKTLTDKQEKEELERRALKEKQEKADRERKALKETLKKQELERKARERAASIAAATAPAVTTPSAKIKEAFSPPAPKTPASVKPKVEPSATETVVPRTGAAVDSPVASTSVTSSTPKNPTKTIKTPLPQQPMHEEKEGFFSKYLPWILLLLLLGALYLGAKKLLNSSALNTDNTEVVADDSDGAQGNQASGDNQGSSTSSTEGAATTSTQSDSKQSNIQPSECIIITGSYLDQQNMDDMASRIRKMGYEVYTEKYGYYTRVGFKFPCEDVNLKLFIEKIRANISKESWYLVPDLSI